MSRLLGLVFYGAGLLVTAGTSYAGNSLQVSGFLIPTVTLASSGLETFSQPNASAFTAAGNPALRRNVRDSQLSWEVAQSRIGFKWVQPEGVEALLEFDFIDFTKSAPTTSAIPRVRRALVQWGSPSSWRFQFGQDWDLVSPLAPFTMNWVGHYFQSGDIGFMRIQAVAYKRYDSFESAWALGLPSQNTLSAPSGVEMGKWPTVSWRGSWQESSSSRYGVSALLASVEPSATDSFRIFAGTFTAFGEGRVGQTRWVSEAYLGQNTFNLGMLGLAYGDRNHPRVRESGAYLTLKHSLEDSFRVFGGVGGSWALNPDSIQSSYSRTGGVATLNSPSTGPGLVRNLTVRAGVEKDLSTGLLAFGELSLLSTTHRLLSQDSGLDPNRTAWVLGTGILFNL